jgi:hypothetical protein
LDITEVSVKNSQAAVGETIPIKIVLENNGNTHATDIEIILCEYPNQDAETEDDIRKNGCDEDRIVMRQVIGALLAPDASEESKSIELYLLYPVSAGSHGVYVVVDPLNEIVETSERDNVQAVSSNLGSENPFLDVAGEVVGKTALPFAVIVLTFALLGVVYLVGKGRRDDVNKRLAEQSSLISVLGNED